MDRITAVEPNISSSVKTTEGKSSGLASSRMARTASTTRRTRDWLERVAVEGGTVIQPEFTALLAGLVLYTSAFIAEIVRSGILALHKGQSEAAMAIGLSRGQVMRLVLLPQALRVIVPPMTSQYLNIVKNSSLAIAIGYPDLVASINVTINQTGQAIENVLIIMAAYLSVSLSISAFMNWYNKRIALRER